MNETIIALIVTSIISVVSLIVSIRSYLIQKPKLKINITDKDCDLVYGNMCAKDDKPISNKVGCVNFNIINDSSVDIEVKDIKIKINKGLHRLIPKNNPFWEFCYFYYMGENNEIDWDGCGINYIHEGLSVPVKIKSYSIKSGVCLFYDFPNRTNKKLKATIILYSAVGKIKKKLKFVIYDENYISSEMKDVQLSLKN